MAFFFVFCFLFFSLCGANQLGSGVQLNYYLDCLWAVDEDLAHFWRDWKRNERRSAIDLTLDIFAQLPISDPPSRRRGTSQQPPPPQHQQHQQLRQDLATSQPFLLERWVLSFNAKYSSSSSSAGAKRVHVPRACAACMCALTTKSFVAAGRTERPDTTPSM